MTFGNNHIQLYIEKDIYNQTLHRYIMKWVIEIDNDKKALYYTTTKLVLKGGAILYNNKHQPYIHTKPHNITQITITSNNNTTKQTKQQHRKKTTYTNIAGDRKDFEFLTGGIKW